MILINCGNFSMFVSEADHYKDGGKGSLHFDVDKLALLWGEAQLCLP